MRFILLFFLMICCISCGSTFVEYDYDKKAAFDTYTTYQYDLTQPTGLSDFDERRFIRFTDSVLQSKGYTRTNSNTISIEITASEYETTSRNTLGVGIGGGGGNVGVGVNGGIPIGGREQHQVITIGFYDMDQEGTQIWEAVSESDVKIKATPDQRDQYFKRLVEKIFKKYPPQ